MPKSSDKASSPSSRPSLFSALRPASSSSRSKKGSGRHHALSQSKSSGKRGKGKDRATDDDVQKESSEGAASAAVVDTAADDAPQFSVIEDAVGSEEEAESSSDEHDGAAEAVGQPKSRSVSFGTASIAHVKHTHYSGPSKTVKSGVLSYISGTSQVQRMPKRGSKESREEVRGYQLPVDRTRLKKHTPPSQAAATSSEYRGRLSQSPEAYFLSESEDNADERRVREDGEAQGDEFDGEEEEEDEEGLEESDKIRESGIGQDNTEVLSQATARPEQNLADIHGVMAPTVGSYTMTAEPALYDPWGVYSNLEHASASSPVDPSGSTQGYSYEGVEDGYVIRYQPSKSVVKDIKSSAALSDDTLSRLKRWTRDTYVPMSEGDTGDELGRMWASGFTWPENKSWESSRHPGTLSKHVRWQPIADDFPELGQRGDAARTLTVDAWNTVARYWFGDEASVLMKHRAAKSRK